MSHRLNQTDKKLRIAAIGFGNRVRKYMQYVREHGSEIDLCAVVDVNPELLRLAGDMFSLPDSALFTSTSDFFERNLELDGVIIGTPDETHYEITMKAISKRYNVLLEKPIAQTYAQCQEISEAAEREGVLIMVCYVLRYHPFYKKVKEILDSGSLGPLISINHQVNVSIDHMTHSYVRGIWSEAETSNPMILSKCCHDLDLITWFSASRARSVTSYGSLKWFRHENAPAGSTSRCIDCPIEHDCPFSAVDLYQRRKEWISNFVVPDGQSLDDVLENEMISGKYGRCVFHCDNDVVDNQIMSMVMDNDVVVSMSMNCFTRADSRYTDIKCAYGEIIADENTIKVMDFKTGQDTLHDFSKICSQPLHANADLNIVADFLDCIRKGTNPSTPTLGVALESHRICFMAETSRMQECPVH